MLEVKNIRVYDLCESIVASGYAMLAKYDEKELMHSIGELETAIVEGDANKLLENKNIKRIIRLVQASKKSNTVKCHDNFLTGIRVSFDLKYPCYISPEFQRYHYADIVTSMSKMHKLVSMDIDECCNKYVTTEMKELLKKYIAEYKDCIERKAGSDETYKAFMKVLSNCPHGLELVMRVSTNYKQLQTMYFQRKDHRLKEDWGTFCEFVKKLPLADYLILGKEVENAD
jgi:hypothetical protein